MTPLLIPVPYIGRNLLFLEEVLDELESHGTPHLLLFRASEADKLARLLEHGTDRAGYPGERAWTDGPDQGRPIRHEDVIFATTEGEIRRGEREPERSTSLKKFAVIERPLFIAHDARCFVKLCDRQYEYRDPAQKRAALLALFPVNRAAPIQGWFSEEDGLSYRALVRPIRGGAMVEVGSWKGLSTAYVGRLAARNGVALHCVDTWGGSSDKYADRYRAMLAAEDVPGAFKANMAALGIQPDVLRMASTDAAARFADASLDLVFLDGSHDRAAVLADLEAWWPRLKPGAVLAGHDHNEDHAGVMEAVAHFMSRAGRAIERGAGSVWWARR
ncbi:class I SAM-dependent methyltransferase [Sorangium atrum]|uniref:Class I SAM-dependent methyltransferase n=1 Tax=Sorangium atrum TaxID=2995308 RepID=A0ABT5C3G6_9BACT|nr:class I SAM-dependent methyltransferase [Sorangium aterium]MDC0680309.1 class I SAM-dependent methyltransferase [Sorangium aterium]